MSAIPTIMNATVFFNTTANITAFVFFINNNQRTVHWADDHDTIASVKSSIAHINEVYQTTVPTATTTTTTTASVVTDIENNFLLFLVKYSNAIYTYLLLLLVLFFIIGGLVLLCCYAIRLFDSHSIDAQHEDSLATTMKNSSPMLEVHTPMIDNSVKYKTTDV